MEERDYLGYLKNYGEGTEFLLRTNREHGIIENPVILRYDVIEGKKVPTFHFIKGDAIFDPKAIGGIENIVSLEESADGMC